jgi:hypothetical protein
MTSTNPYERIFNSNAETLSYGELMDSLWPTSETCDGPVIATAGLEDPSKLRELLDRAAMLNEDDYYFCVIDQQHDCKFASPLLRAIERQRLSNVSLLLAQEANPNGVPYDRQIAYARRYRRLCFEDPLVLRDWEIDVDKEAVGTIASQTEPSCLTDGELSERRTTISQFWTSPNRIIIDHSQNLAQWHSLVKAGTSTPAILDQLMDAGADITAWCDPINDPLPDEEEELQPSQLCISTPIHAAIAAENRVMLHKLIDSSISPNARALIAGNQALTPAQYAIMLGNLETYNILLENGADTSISTPVLNVHALHFAVAQLRVDLINAIRQSSSAVAPVTNMGHTLLHIACLPFNEDQIQSSAPKILQSIHDIRALSPKFRWSSRLSTTYDEVGEETVKLSPTYREICFPEGGVGERKDPVSPWKWPRDPVKDHAKQEAMCRLIVATYKDGPKVFTPDKHGNNMLHYLASIRKPNAPLIDWAKQQDGGIRAWEDERNYWGFTARDLYEEGEDARSSS